MLGLSYAVAQPGPAVLPQPGVATDPAVTAVLADGWRVDYDSPPGAFDPASDPRHLVVGRPGFDALGQPATVTQGLLLTTRVRQPYPNQATLTPRDVAVSDFVYQGDTVAGVANNSVRSYPKPQAMWLDHDLRRVTGQRYTARLAVAHAHARDGRPVAAVRFTASDGVTTVESTVSAMSAVSYAASGLTVPHFAAELDLAPLAADQLVTIDATIYPWVGEAFTVSTDADAYPSPNLTVLKVLNDVAYGTAYAFVDATAGNDGTGTVSEAPATAAAAPFATIAAAAAAIQDYNALTFGRTNASGGVIRLAEGVHTFSKFATVAVGEIPIEIEATGSKTATIWQDAGASILNGCPDKLKVTGVTLRRNAPTSVVFLDSNARLGGDNMLALEDCSFDDAGLGSYAFWIYRPGRMWLIGCDGDDTGHTIAASTVFRTLVSIGSAGTCIGTGTYHAAGCRDLDGAFASNPAATDRPASAGDFLGWSHLGRSADDVIVKLDEAIGPRGAAVVGSVVEAYGGSVQAAVKLSADGVTTPAENVLWVGNTVVGSRMNMLYQDSGTTTVAKSGWMRFSVSRSWNVKGDVFGQDANLVGNWPVLYRVGFAANAAILGSDGVDAPGVGSWLGEIAADGDVHGSDTAPLNASWADDRSVSGSGTGGGDYTPGPAHGLPAIPAGLAPWSHDQTGRPLANDGTAVAGALQPL